MAPSIDDTGLHDHFNDWPNEIGFDANYEKRTPVELDVTGHFPPYTAGILYRIGPGRSSVVTEQGDIFRVSHWFDGFSQTHRFQIVAEDRSSNLVRVFYSSRYSTDHLIEEVRRTGSMEKISFGQNQDPCRAVFKKAQSTYEPNDPSMQNIGVTLSVNMPGLDGPYPPPNGELQGRWTGASDIKTLYAKTDSTRLKKLDPVTLEPIGLATQSSLHPDLGGLFSASHARSDPATGDMFNFNLTFGRESIYRIFRVSASTGKTTILATFPGVPAYIHSLLITKNYVLFCVWNSHVSPAKLQKSFTEAIQPYDTSKPATWYVVDRRGDKGLVATYESCAFFCFHTVNAWEEPSSADPTRLDIVADLIAYDNLNFIHQGLYEQLISSSPKAKERILSMQDNRGTITRFRLPAILSTPCTEIQSATVVWNACKELSPDLPTINPGYVTRKYRYSYTISNRGKSSFFDGIVKFDAETKETRLWSFHAHSPGEPIFVADPSGSNEDDGVVLSVVLNGRTGRSYLLCLDAHDLTEKGRADVNGPVAFGFHGQHIPTHGMPTGDY
ncbi:carotenoid oxygenase family protein [Aspergillus affinis]|uniref:carotenoid oxygenase family protein n=1 Tax=Aspergillus affinis TaxID=1070780 RepID=UPI0022FDEFD8|nr:dioxygenase [Aspergillus affinis]KAI9042676.1 dioxygenase [Aspergillus affinis]